MNTCTCIHKFPRLLVNTHNKFKEYECISMYLLCVYGTTHAYSHMNMNKKNIYKGSEILSMCNDKKCIAVYDLIERSIRIQVLAWFYFS